MQGVCKLGSFVLCSVRFVVRLFCKFLCVSVVLFLCNGMSVLWILQCFCRVNKRPSVRKLWGCHWLAGIPTKYMLSSNFILVSFKSRKTKNSISQPKIIGKLYLLKSFHLISKTPHFDQMSACRRQFCRLCHVLVILSKNLSKRTLETDYIMCTLCNKSICKLKKEKKTIQCHL